MNDRFLIKLKAVRWKSSDYPNAVPELDKFYNKILKTINEYQLQDSATLKKYALISYNQITEEQKRIEAIYRKLQETDLNKLDSVALKKYQVESDYYHAILTTAEDARAAFIEYLASYYPDEFNTEPKIELLSKLLPFNPIAKSIVRKWNKKDEPNAPAFPNIDTRMNYLNIVLSGYFDSTTSKYLDRYFFREFKKAETEQSLEADEFFSGCLSVIEEWEKHLQGKVFKEMERLISHQELAERGELTYENMEGKTIEQKRQETIEQCEIGLKANDKFKHTVNLSSLTGGRVAYTMYYGEVLLIKSSITEAFEKALKGNGLYEPPPVPVVEEENGLSKSDEPSDTTTETIKDWLYEFNQQGKINDTDYFNLVESIRYYFENRSFPELGSIIKVGRVNKKRLGWCINRIFDEEGEGINIVLLKFAKANISTFRNDDFEEAYFRKSNLYKYFTTKTK
jgi:hypothetical protein